MNRQSQILILLGYILSITATLLINYRLNISQFPGIKPGAFGILGTIVLVLVMYFAGALCVAKGLKKYLKEEKPLSERRKKWIKRAHVEQP